MKKKFFPKKFPFTLYRDTANAIEPLKYQLNQLDKMIDEHHQSIDQLRGSLVLNEQKILKIFTDV